MLDLDTPWELMNNLRKWFKALKDWLLNKTIPNMEPGTYEKMKKKLETYWKTWEKPELDDQGNLKNPLRELDSFAKSKQDDSDEE